MFEQQLHVVRPSDCLRSLSSCLPTGGFHEELDQGIELGSTVCNASRTPRSLHTPEIAASCGLS